jgi:hypothetical protein
MIAKAPKAGAAIPIKNIHKIPNAIAFHMRLLRRGYKPSNSRQYCKPHR